tara:strand:+ start:291 stop:506 length:216 start_codon:yes stop_codon:yes gene_type:complete
MKLNKATFLSFVAPLMILLSTIGLTLKHENKKIYYLPIGLMGIFMILEKQLSRKINRQNIFKKIKSYQKVK